MDEPRSTGLREWWRARPAKVKLLLAVVGVLVIVALASVGNGSSSSSPSATESYFLTALGDIQADAGDTQRIQVGHDICKALRSGESPSATKPESTDR